MEKNCVHDNVVIDYSQGMKTCVSCGMVIEENMIMEDHITFSDTGEMFDRIGCGGVTSTTSYFDDNIDTRLLTAPSKILKSIVVSASYTPYQRKAWNLKKILLEIPLEIVSKEVLELVKHVLNELLINNETCLFKGHKRRGIIAWCVYRACVLLNEYMSLQDVCTVFNIEKRDFYKSRKLLYDWNLRTKHNISTLFFKINDTMTNEINVNDSLLIRACTLIGLDFCILERARNIKKKYWVFVQHSMTCERCFDACVLYIVTKPHVQKTKIANVCNVCLTSINKYIKHVETVMNDNNEKTPF